MTGIGSGAVVTVVRVGKGDGKVETFIGNITTLHGGVETGPETGGAWLIVPHAISPSAVSLLGARRHETGEAANSTVSVIDVRASMSSTTRTVELEKNTAWEDNVRNQMLGRTEEGTRHVGRDLMMPSVEDYQRLPTTLEIDANRFRVTVTAAKRSTRESHAEWKCGLLRMNN